MSAAEAGGAARRTERVVGDLTLADPCAWLEPDSPEALAWQARQDADARRLLHGLPGYAALVERLRPHLHELQAFAPRPGGGRWFALRRLEDRFVLEVAERSGGDWAPFADPRALGGVELAGFWPAPDGRHVALLVRMRPGGEVRLHVVGDDGGSRAQLPASAESRAAWLPDGSGLFLSAPAVPGDEALELFAHRVGEAGAVPLEPLELETTMVYPQVSRDGRWLAAIAGYFDPRPRFVRDLVAGGGWRPFLRDVPRMFVGAFDGERYVAATDDGADRGRVVAIPLDAPLERERWVELVPESEAVVRGADVVAGRLVLSEVLDGASRLRVVDPAATPPRERIVPLPPASAAGVDGRSWSHMPIEEPGFAAGEREIAFVAGSYVRSPALMRYDVVDGVLEELRPSRFVQGGLRVVRSAFRVDDGAEIPAWCVERADLPAGAARPTVLYGYGGWRNAFLPVYLGGLLPLVEGGARIVLPSLRGGGERGRAWWLAGRRERMLRTLEDFVGVADRLVADGLVEPGQLAAMGASLGGLNVGTLLVRRPRLLCAAVALVPVTDLLYDTSFADGYGPEGEYGDPGDPLLAASLAACSPYYHVGAAAYPPTLLACAEHDEAVAAAEARKLVALLQQRTTSADPVAFRLWRGAEHVEGELASAEHTAEWTAFLARALGVPLG